MIRPCLAFVDGSDNNTPSAYHLLSCGHIVIIDEVDRRCARNCHHVLTSPTTHYTGGSSVQRATSAMRHVNDTLYCETCIGIPIDRYRILNPGESFPRLRQCFALTRHLLESFFGIHPEQVNALLCPPFMSTTHAACSGYVHQLRCGHLVRSMLVRPCASNCIEDANPSVMIPSSERQEDTIMCQECTLRADMVYTRYARVAAMIRSRTESKIMTTEP